MTKRPPVLPAKVYTPIMESQFKEIAEYYDQLMAGVPYKLWVKYLEGILKHIVFRPKTVLDMACGTGSVSELLADAGYQVVGVDIAPDMIQVAKTKGTRVEYHVQDMAELKLDQQFDLAISLFDSLNYITDIAKLAEGIRRVGEHLVDGGVFIFDVNTEYALSHHFFDQANISSERYPKYIWNSEYDHSTRVCTVNMTFEVMDEGVRRQFKEVHLQRGHSIAELTMMLIDAGFDVLEIFHAYKFRRPTRRSDRIFFVAIKVAK